MTREGIGPGRVVAAGSSDAIVVALRRVPAADVAPRARLLGDGVRAGGAVINLVADAAPLDAVGLGAGRRDRSTPHSPAAVDAPAAAARSRIHAARGILAEAGGVFACRVLAAESAVDALATAGVFAGEDLTAAVGTRFFRLDPRVPRVVRDDRGAA